MPGAKITEKVSGRPLQGNGYGQGGPGDDVVSRRSHRARHRSRDAFAEASGQGHRQHGDFGRVDGSRGAHRCRGSRLEQSRRQERRLDERQGGRVRRAHDDVGCRPGAETVRRQLRRASGGARCAGKGSGNVRRRRPACERFRSRAIADVATPAAEFDGSRSYGPRSRIGCAGFSASARRESTRESHFAADERRDRPATSVAGSGLHRRAAARRGAPVDARSWTPAAPRRRCGRRQDGSREGAGERARRPADPPAVLRRARRPRVDVRVELSAAASRNQAPRERRAPGRRERAGHFLRALSAEAAAARGDQLRGAAGAADRRGGPRRRSVRGVSARASLRFPDVDSGARARCGRFRARS